MATDEAMISAMAPGKLALSRWWKVHLQANGETGQHFETIAPAMAMAIAAAWLPPAGDKMERKL